MFLHICDLIPSSQARVLFNSRQTAVRDWQQPRHKLVYSLIVSTSSNWGSTTKRSLEHRNANDSFTTQPLCTQLATAMNTSPTAGAEGG
jgi:hypothetical protein